MEQNAEAWDKRDEDEGVDLLGFQGQTLVFHRYYDHKRHAAKKTQKTVEAAEKVFFFFLGFEKIFKRKIPGTAKWKILTWSEQP